MVVCQVCGSENIEQTRTANNCGAEYYGCNCCDSSWIVRESGITDFYIPWMKKYNGMCPTCRGTRSECLSSVAITDEIYDDYFECPDCGEHFYVNQDGNFSEF